MSLSQVGLLVEQRLDEKEKNALRVQKARKGNDGTKLTSVEESEYMQKHDVISKQEKRPDPEDSFSFHPPLWNQRLSFVARIVDQTKSKSVSHHTKQNQRFKGKQIIDYGCGAGKFISYLRTSQGEDRELYGIDIDEHELHAAGNVCAPFPADYLNKRERKYVIHLLLGSILEPDSSLRDKDCLVCIEVFVALYLCVLDY